MRRLVLILSVLVLAAAGCGDGSAPEPADEPPSPTEANEAAAPYSPECGQAFEDAAAVDEMQDTNEDLYPAVTACASVEAFAAAAAEHPDALDGTNAETWLTNTCEFAEDPAVKESDICAEISG